MYNACRLKFDHISCSDKGIITVSYLSITHSALFYKSKAREQCVEPENENTKIQSWPDIQDYHTGI